MLHAWHMAALTRAKKMPRAQTLLLRDGGSPKRPRRQTPEEQIAIAKAWTAALARRR